MSFPRCIRSSKFFRSKMVSALLRTARIRNSSFHYAQDGCKVGNTGHRVCREGQLFSSISVFLLEESTRPSWTRGGGTECERTRISPRLFNRWHQHWLDTCSSSEVRSYDKDARSRPLPNNYSETMDRKDQVTMFPFKSDTDIIGLLL